MASSEFILAPRIDENKARQEMQKMDDVARRSAQQMTMEFDQAWHDIGRSGKSTFSKLGGWLKDASASMVGNIAANVTMKLGEIAWDAATKVFDDPEGTAALERERYEQNRDINSDADALGIERGKYAALMEAGLGSGLDQSDMRGLLSGFVGALEKPEMANFQDDAKTNGIDKAFLDFIGSTSQLNTEEAAGRMNEVFGDDDALKASKFMGPIQDLLTKGQEVNFQNIVNAMSGRQVDINGLQTALNVSADQMKSVFANDARLYEQHIKGVAKRNNAQNIVTSENSTDSVKETKLDNLHISVQGQLIADGIEKAEITTGATVYTSASTFIDTKSKQWNELNKAGEHAHDDMEHFKLYWHKLAEFLSVFDLEDMKPGESIHDYNLRRQKEGTLSGPTSSLLIDQTENHAQNNKTRNDIGPLK